MKRTKAVGIFILFIVLVSCTKEKLVQGELKKTVNFSLQLDGCSLTRSTISSDYSTVDWSIADDIYYYTGNALRKSGVTHRVLNDLSSVSFPVTYADGDEEVMFVTMGQGVKGGADILEVEDMDVFSIPGAVPASQDGNFETNHLAVAKAAILESSHNVAEFKPIQAFIRFQMSDLIFSDKTVDKIIVKGGGGEYVCGTAEVSYAIGATAPTITYTSSTEEEKSVTIDRCVSSFETDKDYYVALRGATGGTTYPNGLILELYNGFELLAEVRAVSSITLSPGSIVNLKDLQDNKRVKIRNVTTYPVLAGFTKDMTKEIFLKIEPSDWNGTIVWKASDGSVFDTNSSTDLTLKSTSLTDNGIVTVDGVKYHKYTVKPKSGLEALKDYAPVILSAYLTDNGAMTASTTIKGNCKVYVGNFIDLGNEPNSTQHCMWAQGNIDGDSRKTGDGALKMHTTNENWYGWPFAWGYTHSIDVAVKKPMAGTTGPLVAEPYTWETEPEYTNYWREYWKDGKNGGKYNDEDGLVELQRYVGQPGYEMYHGTAKDKCDDAAAAWASSWDTEHSVRTPTPADCLQLYSDAYTNPDRPKVKFGTSDYGWKITSRIFGYRDMSVIIYGMRRRNTNLETYGDNTFGNIQTSWRNSGGEGGLQISFIKGALAGNYRDYAYSCRPVRYVTVPTAF